MTCIPVHFVDSDPEGSRDALEAQFDNVANVDECDYFLFTTVVANYVIAFLTSSTGALLAVRDRSVRHD